MKQVMYVLTCKDEDEARQIARALVERKQAACVKTLPIWSTFRWQGEIDEANEVMLLIESTTEMFDPINATIAELHSYDQYVLNQLDVAQSNEGVLGWIQESVGSK